MQLLAKLLLNTVIANDTYHDDDDQPYTDVTTTATGIYNTTFTTSGTVNVGDTGVHISRSKGKGALCLINSANIGSVNNYGIEASRSGEGVLGISNKGSVTGAGKVGIKAIHSGEGHINVNSSNGGISANDTGVYAKHENEGDINIENSS